MDISNQIALVTGAGSGFGRALACLLAKQGCRLVLVGRRKDKLQETAGMLKTDKEPMVFTCDVSASMDVDDMAYEVLRECSQLHILVNNAAVFPENAPVHETAILDWDNAIATNLRGPFLLLRAFLPGMIEQDYGRILNISAPLKHYPGASAYCASKCALDSLTKATAFENKSRNLLVNAVEPPMMDTEMHTGGKSPDEVVPQVLPFFDPDDTKTRGRVVQLK